MPSRACTLLYPGNGNKLSTRTILADSDLHCAPLAASGIVPWHNRTKQRKFRNAAGICTKSSHDINEYKWIEKAVKWLFKYIRHFGHRTALIAHWTVWELLIAKHLHDCQNVYVARRFAGTFKGKLKTWQAWGFWVGKLIICHAWELDPWLLDRTPSQNLVYLHRQCLPIEDFQAFQVLRTWSAWQFESFKAIKLHLQKVSSFVCPPLGEYRPEVQKCKSSQSCMSHETYKKPPLITIVCPSRFFLHCFP